MPKLNKNANAYASLAKICADYRTRLKWRNDTDTKVQVVYTSTVSTYHKAFSKEELDEITPELHVLIKNHDSDAGDSLINHTWQYWHEPGLELPKKKGGTLYLRDIIELDVKNINRTVCADEMEMIASIFEVQTMSLEGMSIEVATARDAYLCVCHTFLNEHFPGFIETVKVGRALGLQSKNILENYRNNLWNAAPGLCVPECIAHPLPIR